MIEWNSSSLWVKLSRIGYAKIVTPALPNLIHESIIWQFVKKKDFVSKVSKALKQMKKDKHLENQKCYIGFI